MGSEQRTKWAVSAWCQPFLVHRHPRFEEPKSTWKCHWGGVCVHSKESVFQLSTESVLSQLCSRWLKDKCGWGLFDFCLWSGCSVCQWLFIKCSFSVFFFPSFLRHTHRRTPLSACWGCRLIYCRLMVSLHKFLAPLSLAFLFLSTTWSSNFDLKYKKRRGKKAWLVSANYFLSFETEGLDLLMFFMDSCCCWLFRMNIAT